MTAELIDSHSRELGSTPEENRAETVARLEAFLDSQQPEDPDRDFVGYMQGVSDFIGAPVTVERSDGTTEDEGWTISGVAHKDTLVGNAKRSNNLGFHFEDGQEPFHMVEVLKANGFDGKGNPLSIKKMVPIELLSAWQQDDSVKEVPYSDSAENSPIYDQLRREQNQSGDASTDRNTSRIANFLRTSADRADAAHESWSDTKENTKKALRKIGGSALSRLKNAGRLTLALPGVAAGAALNGAKHANEAMGDAVMTGFEKVEAGIDIAGKKIVEKKESIKTNHQTRQFNRETEAALNASRKEYADEVKALDKKAKSEAKLQAEVDKWESKFAAKEDRRFERSMRKKAAEERRAARRQRWADRAAAIKEAIVSAPEKAGDAMMAGFGKLEDGMDRVGARMVDAKEAVSDKVERSKASVQATRAAGRAALEAFKTTRQVHTEQNKLY